MGIGKIVKGSHIFIRWNNIFSYGNVERIISNQTGTGRNVIQSFWRTGDIEQVKASNIYWRSAVHGCVHVQTIIHSRPDLRFFLFIDKERISGLDPLFNDHVHYVGIFFHGYECPYGWELLSLRN
jgi:hypothetical protein